MNKMIEQLETLPDEIRRMRVRLFEMHEKLENIQKAEEKWELTEKQDISSALDEKGKPLYSNAEKRQAELENRKLSSDYIQKLVAEYTILKNDIDTLWLDWQFKIDTQENIRAIARMGGGAE